MKRSVNNQQIYIKTSAGVNLRKPAQFVFLHTSV